MKVRSIPEKAYKILDIPYYKNDYYSHCLDWDCKGIISLSADD